MKRYANISIALGILCFVGILVISAESEVIPGNLKTIGFITLGYLGVILFSYGWLKRFNLKQKRNTNED